MHNEDRFRSAVYRSTSPDEMAARLNKKKFTHLLIHFDLFQRWVQAIFTDDEIQRINAFFDRHTRKLFSNGGYVLLEMRPTPRPTG